MDNIKYLKRGVGRQCIIRRFLKDSVERDWNIASNMQLTILSLALKGVITILDKDAEEQNFVIAKEGLEVKRE